MKKLLLFSTIFLLAWTSTSHAEVIDAPHNTFPCSSCHSYSLWWNYSPSSQHKSPDHTAIVNTVCMTCHDSEGTAPLARTHSNTAMDLIPSAYHGGTWGVGCSDCHDPHFQDQLIWRPATYLVTGTIDSVSNDGDGNSTVSYSGVLNNPDWPDWNAEGATAAERDWAKKNTSPDRGLIFVQDTQLTSNSYTILSANATLAQIRIQGTLLPDTINTTLADVPSSANSFALIYGQLIRSKIAAKKVRFFDPQGGFVDGNVTSPDFPSGLCQVCHVDAKHYSAASGYLPPTGSTHLGRDDLNCMGCHAHTQGFLGAGHNETSFAWSSNICDICHGPTGGDIAKDIHKSNCLTCHLTTSGGTGTGKVGDPAFGVDGTALGKTTSSNCDDCHMVPTVISSSTAGSSNKEMTGLIHHDTASGFARDGNCRKCHKDASMAGSASTLTADHSTSIVLASGDYGCDPCHILYFENGSWHDDRTDGNATGAYIDANYLISDNHKVHDTCTTCHAIDGSVPGYGSNSLDLMADNYTPGPSNTCIDCHGSFTVIHASSNTHIPTTLGYDSNNDGLHDETLSCQACHYDSLMDEHIGRRNLTCNTCHGSSSAKVFDAIAAGIAGSTIFCDDCHNTDAGVPNGNLVDKHHLTGSATSGDCTKCHVVGPGKRGPQRSPCWYCHGSGKPADPKRPAANKHVNGPAISEASVKDFRVCFSCHLDGGQGYVSGVTPAITPMHGLPGTGPNYDDFYWPFGYYKDANNQWQASDPLIPGVTPLTLPDNLEGDPERWWTWPGWQELNYLGPKKYGSYAYNDSTTPVVQDWGKYDLALGEKAAILKKQDYPTVPIMYGGTFEVPSFDGTGSIGKPTGSGSVSVTISPAAAIVAGAQWRLDGGPWQSSGATLDPVTDRDDHLLEFKPRAGMDEPSAVPVNVVSGQTTVFNGPESTYATCPDASQLQLQVSRTSGDSSFSFAWSSPEQQDTFQVSGWHSGPIECELWRQSGSDLVAVDGLSATTTSNGDGCLLAKDGATPTGDYDLVLRVKGSSCFGNTIDLSLTVTVTSNGAPSPFGQAGGIINQQHIDSLALSTSQYQDFIKLTDNLFVHLNQSTGVLSTFTIDTQGYISNVLASLLLDSGYKMVRVTDTLLAMTYNSGVQGNMESHILTVGIEQDGSVIDPKHDYVFYSGYETSFPLIYPHHDNENLFMVSWGSREVNYTPYSTGLLTVQISPYGVITELDRNITIPPSSSVIDIGKIVYIAGDKYALNQGQYMFDVNTSGAISNLQGAESAGVEMIRVKGNIFAAVYGGAGGGFLKTVSISNNGMISAPINTYFYQPCSANAPQLINISNNVIGVYYENYTPCDGGLGGINLKTFEIADDGRIMVPPLDGMEIPDSWNTSRLLHVTDDIFAFALYRDQSEATRFDGVKTYRISRDNDVDGLTDSLDNCPSFANAGQADADGDLIGDACDTCPNDPDNDIDGDGVCGDLDNCQVTANPLQEDADGDSVGNACDNCPVDSNTGQEDNDGDGVGNVCDPTPDFNATPTLTIALPNGETTYIGDDYTIRYSLEDIDDVVTAAFYWDTDNSGFDGTAIAGVCALAPEGVELTCSWDMTSMIAGNTYYVYGIVNDGHTGEVSVYSGPLSYMPYCSGDHLTNTPFANSSEAGVDGLTDQTAYTVCTLAQLNELRNHLDKHFVLKTDIDAADTASGTNTEAWNTASGWLPIGASVAPFIGEFDGAGHVISNLYINRTATYYVGLFASVSSPGLIKNIGLIDVDIHGRSVIGALAGSASHANISNVNTTGTVSSGLLSSNDLGGLVGYGGYAIINNSHAQVAVGGQAEQWGNYGGLVGNGEYANISNSSASGDVTSTRQRTGGLVGYGWGISITNSYATGNVNSNGPLIAHDSAGGLVGYGAYMTISRSYATGSVSGGNYVGGLLGYDSSQSTVANSYATGMVTGSTAVGGLLGWDNSTTIDSCYTTGNISGVEHIGGLSGFIANGTSKSNSFSIGEVSGNTATDSNVGALLGTISGPVQFTSNLFYNSAAAVTNAGGGLLTDQSAFATGDTLLNLQDTSTPHAVYSSWDFITIWQETPGGFPTLR